jgi:3-hydroxyisobutyrate dehydrogenase-like beta-hydroxyacid dehydrogenase
VSGTTIGFIGLGNMGTLMARAWLESGVKLIVYDLRKEAVDQLQARGATPASSCREVAAAADVVVSVVRDESQNDQIIFGEAGIWKGLRPGSTLIISSTVSPGYCRNLHARCAERGVRVLDAAVSTESRNFTPGRESAVFTLMVGGDEEVFAQCRPLFESLTRNVFHMGPVGMGQTCKLVNNLAAFGDAVFARECLNLGVIAGLDFEQMVEAMRLSTGYSRGLMTLVRQMRNPHPPGAGPSIPAGSKSLGDKDLDHALELAEEVGAETPLTRFMMDLDLNSIYKTLGQ